MSKLLIVESPAKCKKIESYLGDGYKCVASFGHLRELKSLDDIELHKHEWKLHFKSIAIKKKQIDTLKKEIDKAEEVLLATDDDREGEAIAWHICMLFHLNPSRTKRIKFHEITKQALQEAVRQPIYLDLPLVNAQQARQVLDLVVGFKLSPLLWKSIAPALSAGRCQTPALKIIYENHLDIQENQGKEVYDTTAYMTNLNIPFTLNKQIEKKETCETFLEECVSFDFVLNTQPMHITNKKAPLPFITSTLQQFASNELHISPKETMKICQELYENGFITYMRTDNKKYSSVFIEQTKKYILETYSDKYISSRLSDIELRTIKSTNKLTQEAHEGIRTTDIKRIQIDDKYSAKTKKMYSLIWKNTLQSCMSDAVLQNIKGQIPAPMKYTFEYTSSKLQFDGFLIVDKKVSFSEKEFNYFQNSKKDVLLHYKKITSQFKLIELKNHYTEARLVQLLEEKGIGRPSTFSMLVDKIQERKYVEKKNIEGQKRKCIDFELIEEELNEIQTTREFGNEKNKLVITHTGILVIQYLLKHFEDLFHYNYTKELEDKLDLITQDKIIAHELCYQLSNELDEQIKLLKKEKVNIKIDQHHSYVMTKNGPAICKKENKETTYYNLKENIDLEKLKNNEYKLEDLIKKENCLGIHEEEKVILKKGKYGLYAEWGTQKISLSKFGNRPMENIRFSEVLPLLVKSDFPVSQKNMIRMVTENCSIRSGKFGHYIFHQTKEMTKPTFLKLKGFPTNYQTCEKQELLDWIQTTYKIVL